MRILFLTHYYPPESNAPALRTHQHCRRWAAGGHEVHVVAPLPSHPTGVLYPDYRRPSHGKETLDGVHVHRVCTHLAPNQGVVRRTLGYLSYVPSATWKGLRLGRFDVIIATSPQFFCAVAGWALGAAKRTPWVFELRDLWPESIAAVGAVRASVTLRALSAWARFLYRKAAAVVCLTRSFVREVQRQGVPAARLHYVPNGVDLSEWPADADGSEWRRRLSVPGDRLLVCYAGTLGMAHGLGTVLDAAERLQQQGEHRFQFVLAGDGAERRSLEADAARRGLRNLRFLGQVPHAEIPQLLAASDIVLVNLRDTPVFRTVLPSKMFEAMASGRPVLLGVEGEARDLLERAGAGVAFRPEDAEALCRGLNTLAADPVARRELGARGREFVLRELERGALADRMLTALRSVVAEARTKVSCGAPMLPARAAGNARRQALSIVVPVRNEALHLRKFLSSMEQLQDGGREVEVLFAEGRSEDGTRQVLEAGIKALVERRPSWTCRVLDNPTGRIPPALNRAIGASRGEIIFRLDAHTLYPADYLERCLEALEQTGAENVGGVVRAVSADESPTAKAIARARNDLFATGPGSFRTESASGWRRSVPFGCFPRRTFERWGLYDCRLWRNQDLELNYRIWRGGGRVYQRGDLRSSYIAPARFSSLLRKHLSNGWWNVSAFLVQPGCVGWKHALPAIAFLAWTVVSACGPWIGGALALGFLSMNGLRALLVAKGASVWRVAWAFVVAQAGHAFGQIAGMLALPWLLWRCRRQVGSDVLRQGASAAWVLDEST